MPLKFADNSVQSAWPFEQAGIYGEAWKVPPEVYKGALECYRHNGTACDAYSDGMLLEYRLLTCGFC